jgi:hypothetical protein
VSSTGDPFEGLLGDDADEDCIPDHSDCQHVSDITLFAWYRDTLMPVGSFS